MNRNVPVTDQLVGSILAENLYDAESKLLLRAGVELTTAMISLLRKRNKFTVDVELAPAQDDACDECGSIIGLELPRDSDDSVLPWVCPGCGSIYFGSKASIKSDVAPVSVILLPEKQLTLPPAVERAFNESQIQRTSEAERRRYKRIATSIRITIVPLDNRYRISGEPTAAIATNISRGGICLIIESRPKVQFLYLEVGTDRKLQRIAQMTRIQECGSVYEVGCQFICRVANHFVPPKCSVTDCSQNAVCEVFRVNVYIPEGELFFERDDSCLYLCSDHVVENEELAQGARQPRGIVHYPHSNQKRLQGLTVYKPLRLNQTAIG